MLKGFLLLVGVIDLKFESYSDFNDKFSKEFLSLKESRPCTFFILEYYLRLMFSDQEYLFNPALKSSLKIKIPFFRVGFFIGLLRAFSKFYRPKNAIYFRSSVLSDVASNFLITECSSRSIRLTGFMSIPNSFLSKFKLLFSRAALIEIFLGNCRVVNLLADIDSSKDDVLFELCSCPEWLDIFENASRSDIRDLIDILNYCKISKIVIQSDQTVSGRLLTFAAQQTSIPSAVLAHGEFKGTLLVGAAPVVCNKLFVWGQSSFEYLSKQGFGDKVCIANGIKSGSFKLGVGKKIVVLAASPLYGYSDRLDDYKKLLVDLSSFISNSGWKFLICPHPLDNNNFFDEIFIESNSCAILRGSLSFALYNASIIIGGDTSALFEAAQSGLKSVRISELGFPSDDVIPGASDGVIDSDYLSFVANPLIVRNSSSASPQRPESLLHWLIS